MFLVLFITRWSTVFSGFPAESQIECQNTAYFLYSRCNPAENSATTKRQCDTSDVLKTYVDAKCLHDQLHTNEQESIAVNVSGTPMNPCKVPNGPNISNCGTTETTPGELQTQDTSHVSLSNDDSKRLTIKKKGAVMRNICSRSVAITRSATLLVTMF